MKERNVHSKRDYVKDHLLLNVVPLYVSCVGFSVEFCSSGFV